MTMALVPYGSNYGWRSVEDEACSTSASRRSPSAYQTGDGFSADDFLIVDNDCRLKQEQLQAKKEIMARNVVASEIRSDEGEVCLLSSKVNTVVMANRRLVLKENSEVERAILRWMPDDEAVVLEMDAGSSCGHLVVERHSSEATCSSDEMEQECKLVIIGDGKIKQTISFNEGVKGNVYAPYASVQLPLNTMCRIVSLSVDSKTSRTTCELTNNPFDSISTFSLPRTHLKVEEFIRKHLR